MAEGSDRGFTLRLGTAVVEVAVERLGRAGGLRLVAVPGGA
ncbi:hypothetical protein [Streptomyces sp. NPDC020141]